jgi:hypothetical protein
MKAKAEKIAEKAMKKVAATVGDDLSKAQLEKIRIILADLAIDIADETARHCTKAAAKRFGPKTGLAADIADENKRSKLALVTNLQSMR